MVGKALVGAAQRDGSEPWPCATIYALSPASPDHTGGPPPMDDEQKRRAMERGLRALADEMRDNAARSMPPTGFSGWGGAYRDAAQRLADLLSIASAP